VLVVPARASRVCDERPEVAVMARSHIHLAMVLTSWVPVGPAPVA
jgi:hypothetical protein